MPSALVHRICNFASGVALCVFVLGAGLLLGQAYFNSVPQAAEALPTLGNYGLPPLW
jgi:hypothetical protein